jgi:hypothetical protein
MKARITFFFLLGIGCSLAHFELVLMAEGTGDRYYQYLWQALTAPVIFCQSTFWAGLYSQPYAVLAYIFNSLLWGFCLAAVIFWLRLLWARRPSISLLVRDESRGWFQEQ